MATGEDDFPVAHVTYVAPDGTRTTLDVEPGTTVMQNAITNGVDGIVAECGGDLQCATCHVYVDPAWIESVGGPSEMEDEMLDETACLRQATSRTSCQIVMSDELDGLIVHLPEFQV